MAEAMLSHLRVLDFTRGKAGPYCTRLLADFGAHVVKVEPPKTGDPTRSEGPFIKNQPGLERSTLFHWLNPGKQSITLNLEHPKALEILTPLLQEADVLVESFKPGTLEQLGLSKAAIADINPRLIVTSISHFGQSGPYRDFEASDIVLYALSGAMYLTGDGHKAPLNSGPAVAEYTAGLHGYIGTLMALYRRHTQPQGEYVEVSAQESALENIEIKLVEALHERKPAQRNNDQHLFVPWKCYPTADGYAAAIGGPMRNWRRAATMFEDPRLTEPPFDQAAGRIRHREAAETLLGEWFQTQQKRAVHQQGQSHGLAFAYLADLAEVFEWQQPQARQFFQPSEPHPEVGSLDTCGLPFRPGGSNPPSKRAPLLGEHNPAIYGERLGHELATLESWQGEGLI